MRTISFMNWVKRLFGPTKQSRTRLDEVQEVGEKLVVAGYRHLAAYTGCAPTSKTSDQQIIEMYKLVGTAFRKAANQRGERLPGAILNYIVWKFLLVKERLGDEMVDQYLACEIKKYHQGGLRPEYQRGLKLF
jgi:hypothetical protein